MFERILVNHLGTVIMGILALGLIAIAAVAIPSIKRDNALFDQCVADGYREYHCHAMLRGRMITR